MNQTDPSGGTRKFGRYLRQIREQKRISLDAVEELTAGYPERVTKSHLSRIENGHADPTFPRMFALSQIYGVPISSLAERFELDLYESVAKPDTAGKSAEEIFAELDRLKTIGNYRDSLILARTALEEPQLQPTTAGSDFDAIEFRLFLINALGRLGRFESAKADCEELLNSTVLSTDQKVKALLSFVNCCYNLQRYTIAHMGLEKVDRIIESESVARRLLAITAHVRAQVSFALGDLEGALSAFRNAEERFEECREPFDVCKARMNQGQVLCDMKKRAHATRRLRLAISQAEQFGYEKLLALGLGHMAALEFASGDQSSTEAYALRSNAIARPREFTAIVFRNCFYLRKIAQAHGDTAAEHTHTRTLRTYLGRLEKTMREADEFRAELAEAKQ